MSYTPTMSRPRRTRNNGELPPPPTSYNLQTIRDKAHARQDAEQVFTAALDELALECVQAIRAGVSLTYVAEAAEVSRMTVHRWVKQMGE